MQKAITLTLILSITFTCGLTTDEKYTTKYDDIDVDAIINSPRILKNYMECVLKEEKCTPEGKELSKNIPDAIQTDCSRCSEKQKDITNRVLQHVIDNEKDYWEQLEKKFDPEGNYGKKYISSKHDE